MNKDRNVGNIFLDVVLVGVVMTTATVIFDLLQGDGVEPVTIVAAAVTYGAYSVGALRAGASPGDYLRDLTRRSSEPYPTTTEGTREPVPPASS